MIVGQLTWLVGRGATAPEQTTNSLAFDGDGMRRHRIDHQGSVRGWRMFDMVDMASKMSATTPRERHFAGSSWHDRVYSFSKMSFSRGRDGHFRSHSNPIKHAPPPHTPLVIDAMTSHPITTKR